MKCLAEFVGDIKFRWEVFDTRLRWKLLRIGRRWTARLREARLRRFPEKRSS